jgi:hypothetical protein
MLHVTVLCYASVTWPYTNDRQTDICYMSQYCVMQVSPGRTQMTDRQMLHVTVLCYASVTWPYTNDRQTDICYMSQYCVMHVSRGRTQMTDRCYMSQYCVMQVSPGRTQMTDRQTDICYMHLKAKYSDCMALHKRKDADAVAGVARRAQSAQRGGSRHKSGGRQHPKKDS